MRGSTEVTPSRKQTQLFAGAKESRVLDAYEAAGIPQFSFAIDWGWFRWFIRPFLWLLQTLFAFAGIWRPWTGVRGPKRDDPVEEDHLLYSFLTTEPNGVVGPVHPKAMPVLLTKPEEWRTWLEAPVEEALQLQRPLRRSAVLALLQLPSAAE